MVVDIPGGKLIVTAHEVMVKLEQSRMTLRAQVDDISLLSGAKMLIANGGSVSWSLSLHNDEQLKAISDVCGIAIKS
ncbi:DUF3389 family protein [Veronia pacifica]|uniref:PTS sugar transporter subunit IIA n=1 Tax=Veronia pacifica TaxID=1080227 RepID=A0A1C3EG75_9GAMM|nr:DUF3389 family protein [Veronia pacifica]ODA32221.1 PTS sugar transporter subunit IIA [Veronia pacifica]